MPAYSFSRMEFVLKILDGSKPHTMRPRRKRPTKAGDMLTLYYKQRTRECRAIGITVCKQVTPVVIYTCNRLIKLNGHLLSDKQLTRLAHRDGFENWVEMFRFFERYEQPVLLGFELVEWEPDRLIKLWDLNANDAKERMARMRAEVDDAA